MNNVWKKTKKTGRKKLLIGCSQKGGCGKSLFVRSIAELMRAQRRTVAVYDADGGVGTTYRALASRDENGKILPVQDPLTGAVCYSLREEQERDHLLDSLSLGAPTVLHDLPGGSLLDLAAVVEDGRAARFSTLVNSVSDGDYELTFLHLVTTEISTMRSVGLYASELKEGVNHVAVRNLGFGDEEDFAPWHDSKARQILLDAGGKEIWFPKLDARLLERLDETHLSMGCALPHPDLTFTQGSRLRKFRSDMATEMNTIAGWLV